MPSFAVWATYLERAMSGSMQWMTSETLRRKAKNLSSFDSKPSSAITRRWLDSEISLRRVVAAKGYGSSFYFLESRKLLSSIIEVYGSLENLMRQNSDCPGRWRPLRGYGRMRYLLPPRSARRSQTVRSFNERMLSALVTCGMNAESDVEFPSPFQSGERVTRTRTRTRARSTGGTNPGEPGAIEEEPLDIIEDWTETSGGNGSEVDVSPLVTIDLREVLPPELVPYHRQEDIEYFFRRHGSPLIQKLNQRKAELRRSFEAQFELDSANRD